MPSAVSYQSEWLNLLFYCFLCRSQCDGQRPACSACVDRGTGCGFGTNLTETHTQALKRKFSELQTRHSAIEDIFDIMRVRSEEEAFEIFQRIRKGTEPTTILRHVNYGNILLQLAVVPEARYRYEFPFMSGTLALSRGLRWAWDLCLCLCLRLRLVEALGSP